MNSARIDPSQLQLKDTVVSINRVTKVVKGGKNLSFSALVVVGDESGHVGYGNGKAKEVPQAIRKAIEAAKKNLVKVPITNNTIPHQVTGLFGSGRVLLKPAIEGTGIIAGGAVRAVMQAAGVQNILIRTTSLRPPSRDFEISKTLRTSPGFAKNRWKRFWDSDGYEEKSGWSFETEDSVLSERHWVYREAETHCERTWLHEVECGSGSRRYTVDSGNGCQGPASGADRGIDSI